MAATFPYTYVACPCTSLTTGSHTNNEQRQSSHQSPLAPVAGESTNSTLNSHDPRANFSLYPYHHLLYCDECHQIRCPRCWTEEIMNWYCPNCLFEVPSSVVKSDGNRCTRNCYNCPCCTAPLSINGLDSHPKDTLSPQDALQPSGPFFLSCPSCDWTSLDVGIQLDKPNKITEQLTKLRASKNSVAPAVDPSSPKEDINQIHDSSSATTSEGKFAALIAFYKAQLSEHSVMAPNPLSSSSYSSPDNLARIMSMYGGLSHAALKKSREKPQPMREASTPEEGLNLTSHETSSHSQRIAKLRSEGYSATTSAEQRLSHPYNQDAHLAEDLFPVAALLRTRRSKRCRTCRHILTKPETKNNITRYKIRLLAQNHIPRLTLRPFNSTPTAIPSNPAFALTPLSLQALQTSDYTRLRPLIPVQYLLTLSNPLFDPVRVTLATPATTPGAVDSRVTLLCPSFDIGAAGDLWDEALSDTGAVTSSSSSMTARPGSKDSNNRDGEDRQPEAGKVWERGRNWTTVVMEVVPGSLPPLVRGAADESENGGHGDADGTTTPRAPRGVDEDVLEIPIFVRVEWETETTAEDAAVSGAVKGAKESREVAFWSILGAGKIVDHESTKT